MNAGSAVSSDSSVTLDLYKTSQCRCYHMNYILNIFYSVNLELSVCPVYIINNINIYVEKRKKALSSLRWKWNGCKNVRFLTFSVGNINNSFCGSKVASNNNKCIKLIW